MTSRLQWIFKSHGFHIFHKPFNLLWNQLTHVKDWLEKLKKCRVVYHSQCEQCLDNYIGPFLPGSKNTNPVKLLLFSSTAVQWVIACVAGTKSEGGGEREKYVKAGKRKGSACCGCFCIPPTIFWTNPITWTVNTWPITNRGLLSMVRTQLLCLPEIVKLRRFFQVIS